MEFDFHGTSYYVEEMEEKLLGENGLNLSSIMEINRSHFIDEDGGILDKKVNLDPHAKKVRRTSGHFVRIWTRLPRKIITTIWKPPEARKIKYHKTTKVISGGVVTETFKSYDFPAVFSEGNEHLAKEFVIIAKIRANPQIKDGFDIRYAFEMM